MTITKISIINEEEMLDDLKERLTSILTAYSYEKNTKVTIAELKDYSRILVGDGDVSGKEDWLCAQFGGMNSTINGRGLNKELGYYTAHWSVDKMISCLDVSFTGGVREQYRL